MSIVSILGNQLGEEGVEIVTATLETIGKGDALASLRYFDVFVS